jgi:hypothetical protein
MASSRRGSAVLGLALTAVAVATSGCSPDWQGALGLTRDEDGEVLLIVVTCGADVERISLNEQNESQYRAPETVAKWQHDGEVSGTFVVLLTGPVESDGWTTTQRWTGDLYPYGDYYFWVDSSDLSTAAIGPLGFTGSQFDQIEPGIILQSVRHHDGGSGPALLTQTVEEFSANACPTP